MNAEKGQVSACFGVFLPSRRIWTAGIFGENLCESNWPQPESRNPTPRNRSRSRSGACGLRCLGQGSLDRSRRSVVRCTQKIHVRCMSDLWCRSHADHRPDLRLRAGRNFAAGHVLPFAFTYRSSEHIVKFSSIHRAHWSGVFVPTECSLNASFDFREHPRPSLIEWSVTAMRGVG
jgi:hypothetical protein